jgi:hypothetical protein
MDLDLRECTHSHGGAVRTACVGRLRSNLIYGMGSFFCPLVQPSMISFCPKIAGSDDQRLKLVAVAPW